MEDRLTQVVVSPAQIHQLIGLSKQDVTNTMINALYRAGIEVRDLKAIHFMRTPQGGCIFRGPTRP